MTRLTDENMKIATDALAPIYEKNGIKIADLVDDETQFDLEDYDVIWKNYIETLTIPELFKPEMQSIVLWNAEEHAKKLSESKRVEKGLIQVPMRELNLGDRVKLLFGSGEGVIESIERRDGKTTIGYFSELDIKYETADDDELIYTKTFWRDWKKNYKPEEKNTQFEEFEIEPFEHQGKYGTNILHYGIYQTSVDDLEATKLLAKQKAIELIEERFPAKKVSKDKKISVGTRIKISYKGSDNFGKEGVVIEYPEKAGKPVGSVAVKLDEDEGDMKWRSIPIAKLTEVKVDAKASIKEDIQNLEDLISITEDKKKIKGYKEDINNLKDLLAITN